ncbi:MAG TPA: hypothetical protein VHP35_11090 [Terriglobia bacterium]|jgi:hypothetical protein|nr:hypothetical protein [Terriglobia bacterium]
MRKRFGVTSIAVASLTFTLVILYGLAALLAQQPTVPPTSSNTANFDFSVYFTGNVRGNLEPCG